MTDAAPSDTVGLGVDAAEEIENPGKQSLVPNRALLILLLVCIAPITLNALGVSFASMSKPLDLAEVISWSLSKAALTDELFFALKGGLHHGLLEWTSVAVAVVTVLLSFTHYKINGNIMVPVIGMALLCSGFIDAFHTLAAMRLIDADAANTDLIPFTWALSRGFHAAILIIGVFIALVVLRSKKHAKDGQQEGGLYLVVVVSVFFIGVSYAIVHVAATSVDLPQTQFPGALITRPYDVVPLLLFLLGAPLFWSLHKQVNSLFSAGILLVLLPEIVLEAHMAFGSSALFDNHFNIAHFLKIIAYAVPFTGLLLDYVKTYGNLQQEVVRRQIIQDQLVKAKEKAEKATGMKSEFLANMSHEIRTPMNGVIGTTGLLLDTKLTRRQRHYATTTLKSAESLLGLINDILDFSKIEAGKLDLENVPFDMLTLASDVAEVLAFNCREKKVEFLLNIPCGTEQYVIGDPSRIRQILFNLLSNAVKFTDKGHVCLSLRSENSEDGKTQFQISVQDTGIGIAKSKIEAVFNEFGQADTSTTRRYGGTGLGLTICRNLAKMMGGGIQVESTVGCGSTFSFTVIVDRDTKPETVRRMTTADKDQLETLRVLSVDDNDMANATIVGQLQGLVFDVTTVTQDECLLTLRQATALGKPFDIVVVDSGTPEMTAYMLAGHMQEDSAIRNAVLILVTAEPCRGDGERAKKAGFAGYLTKPIFPGDVPSVIIASYRAAHSGDASPLITRHEVNKKEESTSTTLCLKNTHILLVEDNAVNRMVAESILERYGCFVTPAGNGKEAVELVKRREFDLIFMDCQMPEMDGFEASGKIREHEGGHGLERTPIIAFTANAMEGDRKQCLDAGMDDYLSKPVKKEVMEAILIKWLSDKLGSAKEAEGEVIDFDVVESLKTLTDGQHIAIIHSYVDFAKGSLTSINEAASNKDADLLCELGHALKASSKQLGAMELGDLAGELEICGRNKDLRDIDRLAAQFASMGEKVLAGFETYLKDNET
ncbi:MAG: response regulator [Kordiimonadaceae bacterium]|nr:response regulator [Kordiimonadaceae bacterium]